MVKFLISAVLWGVVLIRENMIFFFLMININFQGKKKSSLLPFSKNSMIRFVPDLEIILEIRLL